MITQQFASAKTSRKQIPALHKFHKLFVGRSVLDYGGGRYDIGVEYLRGLGFRAEVYDPFNRSLEHNKRVLKDKYSTVLLSNVLNVIREREVRMNVVKNAMLLGEKAFITVYHNNKKQEGVTKDGYQMHKPLSFYVDEIKERFPGVPCTIVAGKIIVLGD